MRVVLLGFFLTIYLACLNAQCCEFEFRAVGLAMETPSNTEIDGCLKNEACDLRYAYAGRLINSFNAGQLDSVHYFFKAAMNHFDEYPVDDLVSLNIVFTYASFLEEMGESLLAYSFYNYINSNVFSESNLGLLSKIGMVGTSGNASLLEDFKEEVNLSLSSSEILSVEDKVNVVLRLAFLLSSDDNIQLLKNNKRLYYNCENNDLKYLFISRLEYFLAQDNDDLHDDVSLELSNVYRLTTKGKFDENRYSSATEIAFNEGDYNAALDFAGKKIEELYGAFSSLEELLAKVNDNNNTISLLRYAKANLYQTRLGKGVEPVKYAFEIYCADLERKVIEKSKSVSSIVSDRNPHLFAEEISILIVGVYLYQETNDVSYLERSMFLLELYNDVGSIYWLNQREKIRKDKKLSVRIKELSIVEKKLKSIDESSSLAEVIKYGDKFLSLRPQVNAGFSDSFMESNRINLTALQSSLAQDSSATLSFYVNSNVLYRLFVSGDTIMVGPMNSVKAEAIALTGELEEMVKNKGGGTAQAETSRRLYRLLFNGISDRLPKRLHIVAGGELTDIPFSALRIEEEGEEARYLGVEHAVSRQFSIRGMQLLEELELKPRYARPLALAPAFQSEWLLAGELRQAGFVLPPLGFNTEEVEKLETMSGGRFVYGDNATLNTYKKNAQDYGIIHLATHALSSETDGLRSRVYLLNNEGEATELYAADVGEETLNADLVVLSACETGGGGRHRAEGKVGLTKAYLAAGARSVVSSSWAVDDYATAELMGLFYDELAVGQKPHDALRTAREGYLESHPDAPPYEWAAFEAYGGMVAVNWDKTSSNSSWWMIGLALIALILGWVWGRKKLAASSDA